MTGVTPTTATGLGDPAWQDLALCREVDPDLFFPEKGESTQDAKRICARCDVRAECLEYALDNDERYGVFGGLSQLARRRLADARGRSHDRSVTVCKRGLHPMVGANIRASGDSLQACRACERTTARRRRVDAA